MTNNLPDFVPIQMYDPKREYQNHKEELDVSIHNVLEHGIFINGPEIKQLENTLSKFVDVKHSIAVSDGTTAIQIALLALGVKPNDEVITVAHTWISTAEVISLINAIPVFIDIEADTFNMNPDKIEEAITQKTKAIIVVSLYGQIANIDMINSIADRYKLPVIEDAAQSFGALYNGRRSCSLTTIGTTSFFPSKPLGCYGDGGACFTNDDELAIKMRAIRSHGGIERFKHEYIGLNGRLDNIHASILNAKFKYFENETLVNRNACADYYSKNLAKISQLKLPIIRQYHDSINTNNSDSNNNNLSMSAWAQYSILVDNRELRDKLVSYMKENGVNLAIFYPSPLHYQKCFQNKSRVHDLSVTEKIADTVFNLPCYGEILREEQDYIIKLLETYFM